MIRIYSRLAIPLIAIFIALNIAARALGSTQPPNPALRGFTEGCEGKPQPCWYGIVMGTPTQEAREILLNRGYKLSSPRWNEGARWTVIADSFSDCSIKLGTSLRTGLVDELQEIDGGCFSLGDLLVFWGEPDYLNTYAIKSNSTSGLYYSSGLSLIPSQKASNTPSPHTRLEIIVWRPNNVQDANLERFIEWQGFMPSWRYCRLEFPSSECVLFRNQTTLPLPTLPNVNTPLPYSVSPTQTPYP